MKLHSKMTVALCLIPRSMMRFGISLHLGSSSDFGDEIQEQEDQCLYC